MFSLPERELPRGEAREEAALFARYAVRNWQKPLKKQAMSKPSVRDAAKAFKDKNPESNAFRIRRLARQVGLAVTENGGETGLLVALKSDE